MTEPGSADTTWRDARAAILDGPGGALEGFRTEEDELVVYVQEAPGAQVWLRTGACWRTHVHCPLLPRLARELAYTLREQADMADIATEPWQGQARVFRYNDALVGANRVVAYGESSGGPLLYERQIAPFGPRVVVEVIDDNMKDPADRVSYARMDTGTARRCADFLDLAADAAQALDKLHQGPP